MVRVLIATIKGLCIAFMVMLCACQSTSFYEPPKIQRPQVDLILEPVEFKVVVHDGIVYYALTSDNYVNLGINMLRVQQALYNMAVWENLRVDSDGPKTTENDRNKGF